MLLDSGDGRREVQGDLGGHSATEGVMAVGWGVARAPRKPAALVQISC